MTDEKQKQMFTSRRMFLFAMLGSVIGLGNIWRFPSILYHNGGFSFLIIYLIILFIIGISHLFLEYGIGFKFKASVVRAFSKINKKYEILGWFLPVNIFLVLTYYVCILSWGLIYLFLSFYQGWGANPNTYFSALVLSNSTPSLSGLLIISIPVVIGTLIMWFLIWLCASTNVEKGIGKMCSIIMPIMFVLMIIIIIFALTLPGASVGVYNLFAPNWAGILSPTLWLVVLAQIAFSMGLGDSTAITFTSYIDKESRLMDNAIIVTLINFAFGIMSSLGIFAILGFMSTTQGVPFSSVVSEGTGLVFVAFPTVFNIMGIIAYIMAPLFFLCLIFIGFTSAVALFEPISSSISEKFDFSRKKSATLMAIIGFLISLIFATGLGVYILNLADSFLNEITLSVILLIEVIVFAWIVGADKLKDFLNENSKLQVGKKWMYIVKYVVPVVIIFLLINGIFNLIIKNTVADWIFELFFVLILIAIPAILTKLPAKAKNFYD